jgi:hypothetical protein
MITTRAVPALPAHYRRAAQSSVTPSGLCRPPGGRTDPPIGQRRFDTCRRYSARGDSWRVSRPGTATLTIWSGQVPCHATWCATGLIAHGPSRAAQPVMARSCSMASRTCSTAARPPIDPRPDGSRACVTTKRKPWALAAATVSGAAAAEYSLTGAGCSSTTAISASLIRAFTPRAMRSRRTSAGPEDGASPALLKAA